MTAKYAHHFYNAFDGYSTSLGQNERFKRLIGVLVCNENEQIVCDIEERIVEYKFSFVRKKQIEQLGMF